MATPTGAQIPISLLADIRFRQGPPMIRDENGQLVGYVFVDVTDDYYEGYVDRAREIVSERVDLPAGYRLEWAGQYKYLLRMKERLTYIVPLTLFIIFVLLYINFGSWKEPLIVLLAVPSRHAGGSRSGAGPGRPLWGPGEASHGGGLAAAAGVGVTAGTYSGPNE